MTSGRRAIARRQSALRSILTELGQSTCFAEFGQHPLVGLAQYNAHTTLLQLDDDLFEHLDAGDIHEGYAVQSDDQRLRITMGVQQGALEIFYRAEKHRAIYRVNKNLGR